MVQKTLRSLGMLIDTGVYKLVEWLLQSIIDLSSVEIFSTSIIEEFSTRIYMILGLIMVFKLMISFFQMLINPEKMDDKEQGAANILKRVVISLALIFLVPSIFDLARTLQTEVLPIIPKVVLGVDLDGVTDEESSAAYSSVGQLMAFYSFSPFFTYQNDTCNDGSILGSSDDETNLTIYSVNTARIHINDTDVCSTEDNFKYSYTPLISTVVGAYLVYVLVSVAVAVAVRAVKLSVCELIAPIPIASYIDPKKSKETFDKWVSISIKTYLDLFIRLIIVYFVIYMFQVLFGSDSNFIQQVLVNVCGGNLFRKSIVVCFVIVGLLQFIKEAPKFLTDMLGLSSAGNFAGMFKGEGFKAIGSTYGGLAGTAGATLGSAIGNAKYALRNGETVGRAMRRAVGGGLTAFGRGALSTVQGKGWRAAYTDNIRKTTGASQRRVNRKAIARISKNEYNDEMKKLTTRGENLRSVYEGYSNQWIEKDRERSHLASEDVRLNKERDSLYSQVNALEKQRDYYNKIGNSDGANKIQSLIDTKEKLIMARESEIHQNKVRMKNNELKIASIEKGMANINEQIEKNDAAISNVPEAISPVKNWFTKAFDDFTGTQSVSGASLIQSSSALSSIRSTYFTGEAMNKLNEEGSKLEEILSMGATFSEIASLYNDIQTGKVNKVKIGETEYNSQQMKELYKKAEKEAAINYVNAVKEGRIRNATIEEGFKQIAGELDGMSLDPKFKNELMTAFNDNPGEFMKSLSDISKRLQTEGKRRQAYERAEKPDDK